MRGLLILSLLLGLLFYSLLSKESVEHNVKQLKEIKTKAHDIADREDYRAKAARDCAFGDDEEASDCLENSYHESDPFSAEEENNEDSPSQQHKKKGTSDSKPSKSHSIAGKFRKFSGGTDIQGF